MTRHGENTEEVVFLNGELIPLSKAMISVDDRSVLYGDSAFETVRAYCGHPFRLWRHLRRLADSCRVLRLEPPMSVKEFTAAVAVLLRENNLDTGHDARVRITVTGGPSRGPGGLDRSQTPSVFITARHYEPPSADDYNRGITLIVSGIKRNSSSPLSGLKSGNYMDSMLARQEALDAGADDAVILTGNGTLSEATSSNLFIVKGTEVLTPGQGCAFLPGVTREAVIDICLKLGIPCREVSLGIETLMEADEVFLTNSMIELMPASRVATRDVPYCPGPVTLSLTKAYRELVTREIHPKKQTECYEVSKTFG